MNLIICPSRVFVVYLLAYLAEYGNGRNFQILIMSDQDIPMALKQMSKELNSSFVSKDEINRHHYEELVIHSFFLFSSQQSFLATIDFTSLTFYSDGIRNGLYGLPIIDRRLDKLIYFGLKLHEQSFEQSLPTSPTQINTEVVSLEQIGKTWKYLKEISQVIIPEVFKQKDLLLTMRYWAMPSSHYEIRQDRNLKDYLCEEFSKLGDFTRVVFRLDPRFNHLIGITELQKVFGSKIEIVLWEELFSADTDFPELLEPESVIWNTKNHPGLFFGFDSSLNVLVGNVWARTTIIWPNQSIYEEYFKWPRSTVFVSEQVQWMKAVKNVLLERNDFEIEIDGFAIEESITQMYLRSAFQERDALTQERDALTQERDALTQERDALANSMIWRRTLFIRRVVAHLRQLR
jgi:hypothetical protein